VPRRQRIEFKNREGASLAAALEVPDREPKAYALFAHCFTCGKDIAAAARIARTLAAEGFAVLRFDFTGLGGSEGDFANTNFASNVEDLLAAADFLRDNHAAPSLLIGHSLGGTAMLAAAPEIPESLAVACIGAPSSPAHLARHLDAAAEEIEAAGEATVQLWDRDFRIKKQFLDDLQQHPLLERLPRLRKALLIMHAPLDNVVGVDEAAQIFTAARHPKNFVSLDGADHMLSRLEDAQYAARTIATWAARYLNFQDTVEKPKVAGGEVIVTEGNLRFLREVSSDEHNWLADEPKRVGGDNLGPDPYEHLLAALGTCTSMTIRMYANRKQWPLQDVHVRLSHSRRHTDDCEGCDKKPLQLEILQRFIRFEGPLDAAQTQRLMEIADRCPVHRTLEGRLNIETLPERSE